LFGYYKNEWNRMEHDGIYSILFHCLLSFCFPSNLGEMEWNDSLIQFNNYFTTLSSHTYYLCKYFTPNLFTFLFSLFFVIIFLPLLNFFLPFWTHYCLCFTQFNNYSCLRFECFIPNVKPEWTNILLLIQFFQFQFFIELSCFIIFIFNLVE
jgi:hypothetical protein